MTNFYSGFSLVEQVEDYVKVLIKENENRLNMQKVLKEKSCEVSLLSLKSTAAIFILNLCDQWKLSAEAKFIAIEMYQQFIINLLDEIFKTVFKKSKNIKIKSSVTKKCNAKNDYPTDLQSNQWNETVHHIIGQMELRAVSCIAIASKFVSNCLHVTNAMAIKFLDLSGHRYTPDTLLKSEIRILKTIKFNIGSLPIVLPYVCAFADLISKKKACILNQEVLDSSLKLLFCFYSCSHKVYERYLEDAVNKNYSEARLNQELILMSKDLVFLSCGVIASASYICMKQNSDIAIKALSEVASIPEDAIAKFSFIIMEETLQ